MEGENRAREINAGNERIGWKRVSLPLLRPQVITRSL